MKYDYLIVGAGVYGAVMAHGLHRAGKKVLVIEKRPQIAGNLYTEEIEGIRVHKYGPHIFHTSNREVWEYIRGFAEFNSFVLSPIARYRDELYHLPFNMNTFHEMWGVITPEEARKKIEEQVLEAGIGEPKNLEEQAIRLVGRDIYEKLIKGYTQKQWGHPCTELPSFIIRRLPVRMIYDNNYFNDPYQGIPVGGYTHIIEKMLEGVEVLTDTDYFAGRARYEEIADRTIFSGRIDAYYEERYGTLEYRSLRFEQETLDTENYQGCAVVNYTEYEVPYTRIIEHKHFELMCRKNGSVPKTVITREYPAKWVKGAEPYYPVNDERNNALYARYAALAAEDARKVRFGGRLGTYRYLDMDQVIALSLKDLAEELT